MTITPGHTSCEDCGKCRRTAEDSWCHDCEYFGCERGDDCTDAQGES